MGTLFTESLLHSLLDAVKHPETGISGFNNAKFSNCTFSDFADFQNVQFAGQAIFNRVNFMEAAEFSACRFSDIVEFQSAFFAKEARFTGATFSHTATFEGVEFCGKGTFRSAEFMNTANFNSGSFQRGEFSGAVFRGRSSFVGAEFSKRSQFDGTSYERRADFSDCKFLHMINFKDAHFHSICQFRSARFGDAQFSRVTFSQDVTFRASSFTHRAFFFSASFRGRSNFDRCTFTGRANFAESEFRDAFPSSALVLNQGASFKRVLFRRTKRIGPLVANGDVFFDDAQFEESVVIEITGSATFFRQTQWSSTALLRMRGTTVDISDATFSFMTISSSLTRFSDANGDEISDPQPTGSALVKVASILGTDASNLLLADVDLTACRFVSAMNLDKVRLEGTCLFSQTPRGVHRGRWAPTWWSPRQVILEEATWRLHGQQFLEWSPWNGATAAPHSPTAISVVYRNLRKSLEDAKNEPGAADFYYGEMEMRRADKNRPKSDRYLVAAYWLISGYGLRVGRALAWLASAMLVTLIGMMIWGIPGEVPTVVSRGVLHGSTFTEVTQSAKPTNPAGPIRERITSQRFEKSLRVVINSVIFRSSGQPLTTSGTYIEMSSRLVEPIFIGLAILAVRTRIKR